MPEILDATKAAGYEMKGILRRILNGGRTPTENGERRHEVVIVGGGAAGIAVAASLKSRKPDLDVAIIDPADIHYYQPGWTMVGGGVFKLQTTARTMASLIPSGVHWIKAAVAAFERENNAVILDGCRVVKYGRLIVAPGLKLNWGGIEGLTDTLGRNGVTSNYRYDLPPTPGSWCKGSRAVVPSSPSRRCRSSARARPRKQCISRLTTGNVKAPSRTFGLTSFPRRACCSGSGNTFQR